MNKKCVTAWAKSDDAPDNEKRSTNLRKLIDSPFFFNIMKVERLIKSPSKFGSFNQKTLNS